MNLCLSLLRSCPKFSSTLYYKFDIMLLCLSLHRKCFYINWLLIWFCVCCSVSSFPVNVNMSFSRSHLCGFRCPRWPMTLSLCVYGPNLMFGDQCPHTISVPKVFERQDNGSTLAAPGTPPRNVRARPVSSSTIVVQWDEPKTPNGVIRVSVIE